jgi:hypothetical protein
MAAQLLDAEAPAPPLPPAMVDAAVEPPPEPLPLPPEQPPPAAEPVPSPTAKARPPRTGRPAPEPRKGVDLAKELEGGRYVEAVVECLANPAADRALCVRAACHVNDAAKARRWLARVPAAQQPKLVAACAALGVQLDPKLDPKRDPKPDCADPMDCPR